MPKLPDEPRRVLITGVAGFIGSHLADALLNAGLEVYGIDDLSTGRLENIAHLRRRDDFHFARASILDPLVLDRMGSRVDAIIHLAAAVGVKLIVEDPVQTIRTNVVGTESVLAVALRYGCPTIVASTSEVYGKGTAIPFCEDDDVVLGPTVRSRWSYAASKMIDEFQALAYTREYELPTVVVRLFNTVGPRQTGRYGMVIPTFVRQALAGEPITVFGNGEQTRCFCHVHDIVAALQGLLSCAEAWGQVVNVGGTEEVSIRQLAERVKARTGSQSPVQQIPYDQAYAPGFEDMERRVPSIDRIGSLLGWQPRHNLDQILDDVIAYERGK
jgi:UDP-glucose 4-epimerase